MKANELRSAKYISMLLKGPFGFGKTLAAASTAVDGPVYLAYFDKKEPVELDYYFRHIVKRPELLDNIEYDVYSSKNANQYLNKLIELSKSCPFNTVITDSVTMLTASAVNWSISFRNPAGAKKDPQNRDSNLMIPDWDEYKVETSLVTQALDICRTLPCNIIWTAHPLPTMKIDQGTTSSGGQRLLISKVNSIVSYGNKVGAIVPGQFTEIYHISKLQEWDSKAGRPTDKRFVSTVGIGDDFAKTSLGISPEFEITNRLFWEVWKEEVSKVNQSTESTLITK